MHSCNLNKQLFSYSIQFYFVVLIIIAHQLQKFNGLETCFFFSLFGHNNNLCLIKTRCPESKKIQTFIKNSRKNVKHTYSVYGYLPHGNTSLRLLSVTVYLQMMEISFNYILNSVATFLEPGLYTVVLVGYCSLLVQDLGLFKHTFTFISPPQRKE